MLLFTIDDRIGRLPSKLHQQCVTAFALSVRLDADAADQEIHLENSQSFIAQKTLCDFSSIRGNC